MSNNRKKNPLTTQRLGRNALVCAITLKIIKPSYEKHQNLLVIYASNTVIKKF